MTPSSQTRVLGALATLGAALIGMAGPASAPAAFPGADGRVAYVVWEPPPHGWTLYSALPDGSDRVRLAVGASEPSFSPDGNRLVFVDSRRKLVTMAATGGEPQPVTTVGTNSAQNADPSFSPDAHRILYTDPTELRSVRTDGERDRVLLRGSFRGADWAPDGRRIVFAGSPPGEDEGIWAMKPNGSRLVLIRPGRGADPEYSPDGRRVLFFQGGTVRIMRADGSRERRINEYSLWEASWAPSGDGLVGRFVGTLNSGGPDCSDIWTMSKQGELRTRVTYYCPSASIGGNAMSPAWQPLPSG